MVIAKRGVKLTLALTLLKSLMNWRKNDFQSTNLGQDSRLPKGL